MTVEVIELPPPLLELVDVTPLTVELQDVVVGPPGPRGLSGSSATVTAEIVQAIVAEVEEDLADGPDLVLLYDNAKV